MDRDQSDTDRPAPNKPVDTLRDGSLKASIFRNEGDKGHFYATSFARTYRDADGNPRDTHSFIGTDLLKLSELARAAYTRTHDLRREDSREQSERSHDPRVTVRKEEFKQQRSADSNKDKPRDQQR